MTTREYVSLVALLDEVYEATTTVVSGLDDASFGRRTRTELWTVQDLLFHQMCDAQRALVVFTTAPDGRADTSAVSYWSSWQPGTPGADAHARYASRAAAAYGQPSSLVGQWTETSRAAVRAALTHAPERRVATQGHVLEASDFVHTLAVEGVVHHLDLTLEVPSPGLRPTHTVWCSRSWPASSVPSCRRPGRRPRPSSREPAVLRSRTRTAPSSDRRGAVPPVRLTLYRREMATVKAAAVQAAYVLMDRQACVDKAVRLIGEAAEQGAQIVVFPEAFIPGTPIWIDSRPIWDGDEQWFAMLADQAVVVPGPVTDALGEAARETGTYVVIGVEEREPHGSTIYNTTLYLGPDGALLAKHRKLMPTGSERTVWGWATGRPCRWSTPPTAG